MRIAIIGAGGVGGYFGARLAAAGEQVTFIARGAQLDAMRKDGLRVISPLGDLAVHPVRAESDPATVGPVDLVLVAVKLWDTEAALHAARPLVGSATGVISLQNGVDAVDALTRSFGKAAVLGGVAHIAAVIEQPGVIRHTGTIARLTFGELDGSTSARAATFLAACRRARIEAFLSADIRQAIWEKFVFLVAVSGMTTLIRLGIGPIRSDPVTRAMLGEAMQEVAAVASSTGIVLPDDTVDRLMQFCDSLPPGMVSSMLGDLQRGNRLELEWLAGAVVRMGAELGVSTPVNRAIYGGLKLYADGKPG